MPNRWIVSSLMVAAIGACSTAPDEPMRFGDEQPLIGETSASLELANTGGVTLVDRFINGTNGRSTAALRLTNVKPTMPHGSCGMTWVSKHYGVTAAHCVDHLAIRAKALTVEEIRVDALNTTEFSNYMTVTGSWQTGFQPGGVLRSGYAVQRYTDCYVARRCDPDHGGRQGCPIQPDVDIALIKCPSRLNTEFAKTTSSLQPLYGLPADVDDRGTLNINVWWYHEVYDLPAFDDGSERWAHYGKYLGETTANQNWHYMRAHQLLPLVSYIDSDGVTYKGVPSTLSVLNEIDAPICHGTSGSGVFIGGLNVLLGPAINAGFESNIDDRLCEPVSLAEPGKSMATYVRGVITDAFVRNSAEVGTDF